MPFIGNTTTSFNVDSNNINNGAITSEKIATGAVVNADVNDSASIAGTKISADFGVQNLSVGTGLLFVDATNDRVGIGTTSPNALLHLRSDTPYIRLEDVNDEQSWQIEGRAFFGIYDINDAAFKFAIDGSGNVGIGTTSPSVPLQVRAAQAEIKLTSDAGGFSQLQFGDTADEVRGSIVYSATDDKLFIRGYNNQNAITVDSSERVGIGTTSPGNLLEVVGAIETSGSSNAVLFAGSSSTPTIGAGIHKPADDSLAIVTGSIERARIDDDGRLLIGTDAALTTPAGSRLTVAGTDYSSSSITAIRYQENANGASLLLMAANGTQASPTSVSGDNELGKVRFYGHDGTDFAAFGASIECRVDNTPSENVIPGRLQFFTSDTAGTSRERMRISSNGVTRIQKGIDNGHILTVTGGSSSRGLTIDTAAVTVGATTANDSEVIFDAQTNISSTVFGGFSFRTGGGERLRIQRLGGISFNGDTAAANALDDYEEGTWTPAYSGSDVWSYTTQLGYYVKVGKFVQVSCEIVAELSTINNLNGQITVQLPFRVKANDRGVTIINWVNGGSDTTGTGIYTRTYKATSITGNYAYVRVGRSSRNIWPASTNVTMSFNLSYTTSD